MLWPVYSSVEAWRACIPNRNRKLLVGKQEEAESRDTSPPPPPVCGKT